MRSHLYCRLILMFLFCVSISACSLFGGEHGEALPQDTKASTAQPAAGGIAATEGVVQSAAPGTTEPVIELVWQVPGESVEKYHLFYGFTETDLNNHIVLEVSRLEKLDDPVQGPVFRYELRGIPTDRDLYFSLKAENRFGVSQSSSVSKIQAETGSAGAMKK